MIKNLEIFSRSFKTNRIPLDKWKIIFKKMIKWFNNKIRRFDWWLKVSNRNSQRLLKKLTFLWEQLRIILICLETDFSKRWWKMLRFSLKKNKKVKFFSMRLYRLKRTFLKGKKRNKKSLGNWWIKLGNRSKRWLKLKVIWVL